MQRQLNIALLLSALAVLACIALIVWLRHADSQPPDPETQQSSNEVRRADSWIMAGGSAFASAILIDWVWALPVAVVWAVAIAVRQTRLVAWVGVCILTASALIVTYVVRAESPFPDAGWPLRFEWLHPWTLLGVALLVSGSLTRRAGRNSTT